MNSKAFMKSIPVAVLVMCGVLTSCGKYGEEAHILNVKVVDAGVQDGSDPATFQQDVYTLRKSTRLLLRSENMMTESSPKVPKSAYVRVYFPDVKDGSQWKNALVLCPLTRQWMMLATWHRAHPFGSQGKWNTPGGDFSETGCMKPFDFSARTETSSTDITRPPTVVPASVRFDAAQFMKDYVVGRENSENFGLILMTVPNQSNVDSIAIVGDTSSYKAVFEIDYGTGTWN